MIVYGLLIYLGVKACFPMWYFIVCTVGICFSIFKSFNNFLLKAKFEKLIEDTIETLEDMEKSLNE